MRKYSHGLLGACVAMAMLFAGCASRGAAKDLDLSWASKPLSDQAGDASRGRSIVAQRQQSMCVLCHPSALVPAHLQGNLAPDLAGVGQRLSEIQLRAHVMDARRVQPDSIMPPYHRSSGLARVPAPNAGRPLLTAQEVEDVVAYLRTL